MKKNLYSNLIKIAFTKKFILIFSVITIILSYIRYNTFLRVVLDNSFYSYVIFNYSDFFYQTYILSNLYLVLLYVFIPTTHYYNLVFIRFKNRRYWYLNNTLGIVILAFLLVASNFTLFFLQSLTTLDFENTWSEGMAMGLNVQLLDSISPFIFVINNVILLTLYMITIGLTLYTLILLTKKPIVSVLLTMLISITNTVVFLTGINYLNKFSFTYNSGTIHSLMNINNPNVYYLNAYLYWIMVITFLFLIGWKINKSNNYLWDKE